jgi:hypothetical protein
MINVTPKAMRSLIAHSNASETVRVIRLFKWGIQVSMEVQARTFKPLPGDLVTFRESNYKVEDDNVNR